MPTLQIADKPTLDKVLDLLSHKGVYVGKLIWENRPYQLPYDFCDGCAVVYHDEIHILGSSIDGFKMMHYKWNGSEWVSASILPYNFYKGSAVVYNDKIHILGGAGDSNKNLKNHYSWNGVQWIPEEVLPYNFLNGDAVVWNNYIHIFGSSYENSNGKVFASAHWCYDGYKWIQLTNVSPGFFSGGIVKSYDNNVYRIGGGTSGTGFSRFTGLIRSNITPVVPYKFADGGAIFTNHELHLMGSSSASTLYLTHYMWNGTEWTKLNDLPYKFYRGCSVLYRGEIHILGSFDSNNYRSHYIYDATEDSWNCNDNNAESGGIKYMVYYLPEGCIIHSDSTLNIDSTVVNSDAVFDKDTNSYAYKVLQDGEVKIDISNGQTYFIS